ncbi:hypothetical protein CO009_02625 [Candidatus Shapirobacteria bacterium CG_4_8_14_3_um_filter_35_11]|uniref:IrrE N-terminal-like domain-containing protein n=2 Tax=Candidatus Shapironibacteriota TaxID=1752721 RepID=A0A2M7BQ33_9BACT|nr:MAG: hypothetical protein COS53_01660 [Candidatus Shapirobacteria bacterium CG03_land_8_20_14_0_80_35_14]PJC80186.1 MAG: hypothetical protein CO009_02625 [Candidatus Shapirobacteria bacterium CG_4_8_14_3_um_filter_35_11]
MNGVALSMDDVHQAASKFLEEHNPTNQLPIPIEEIAELKLGIFVLATPGIKKLIGIDGFISSDFSQITIDDYCFVKYPERTRFTIAHEIGHKILHQDWYSKHGPTDFGDYHDFFSKISEQDYRYMEIQAQTFAGLVLVPTELLKNEFKSRLGRIPINEDVEILQPIFNDLLTTFKVSGEVLYRRMVKEGIVKKI